MKKTRIAIAGMGGIGGYIGGKLAHYYATIENIDIIFIARGETYNIIREKGLELISKGNTYTCIPTLIANDPASVGEIDIFIICTKQFDVANIMEMYKSCLTPKTTIITTQNTVNGKETILPYLPKGAMLLEGCMYISTKCIKPGQVMHSGDMAKLIFGTQGENYTEEASISKIFNDAGIDTLYTTDISKLLWKKFIFVSPAAIVTSLFDVGFAEIPGHLAAKHLYENLVNELLNVAKAKNIETDEKTLAENIKLLGNFKENTKSSFQIDLEKNKPTEIRSLVNYVIEQGEFFNVATPSFSNALTQLSQKYETLLQ